MLLKFKVDTGTRSNNKSCGMVGRQRRTYMLACLSEETRQAIVFDQFV